MELVLAIISVIVSVVALVVAYKRKPKDVITKETKMSYEHPFTYDEKNKCYYLDGGLYVNGVLCCKQKEKKGE